MRLRARSAGRRRTRIARSRDARHELGPIEIEALRPAHCLENLIFDAPVAARLRASKRPEPNDAVVRSQFAQARFDWLGLATWRQHADASVQPREVRPLRRDYVRACDRCQSLLAIAFRQRLQGITR
jgi:hypothetical protein